MRRNPRQRAGILIMFVWLFPLALTVVAIFVNDCDKHCICCFDHVPNNQHIRNCKYSEGCSNFWPPMRNFTIILGSSLYLVYLGVLASTLIKSYQDLRAMVCKHDDSGSKSICEVAQSSKECTTEGVKGGDQTNIIKEPVEKIELKSCNVQSTNHDIFLSSVRKSLTVLVSLFLAYLIGTLPFVISAFLHSVSGTINFVETKDMEIFPIFLAQISAQGFCSLIICLRISAIREACRLLAMTMLCRHL